MRWPRHDPRRRVNLHGSLMPKAEKEKKLVECFTEA